MRKTIYSVTLSGALILGLLPAVAAFGQDATQNATQDANSAPQADSGQSMDHHGGMRGPMSPDMELSHLTRSLSLSTDQQTQIKPILQNRQDQMMQIHSDSSMARPDKMAKMKSLDDDSNTKLEAVLNDQQKTKYEKMIADRKEKMKEMRAERGNGQDAPSQ
jgi:protein CpxP